MNINREEIEKNVIELTIEVPFEDLALGKKRAAKKLAKEVNIPGFRKGKAPEKVIENYVGVETILKEAAEEVLPEQYFQAIQKEKIEPVANPEIEIVDLEDQKPFVFKAKVTVKPEVELGEYKGLKVEKLVLMPDEEDIVGAIEKMRNRVAKQVEIDEGEVLDNDIAVIDFEGFKDDVAFEGGKADNYELKVGSNSFIPGFEEQVLGMKVGEEKDIDLTFPEEYHEKSLAGQPVVFKVKVNNIKREELPEIDDEFVKDVSEESDTVEELKEEVKGNLTKESYEMAENLAKNIALTKTMENATVDVPQAMIEQRIDQIIEDFTEQLQMQGLDIDKYFQFTNSTMKDLRDQNKNKAEQGVLQDLVLEAIAKEEEIKAEEKDINERLEEMSKQYGQTLEQIKAAITGSGRMGYLEYGIMLMKTLDFIFDNAEIEEKIITDKKAFQKEQEKKAKAKEEAKKEETKKEEK